MAGNPNWWSMRSSSQQPSALLSPTTPSLLPSPYALGGSSSLPLDSMGDNQQYFPQSWSQLLMGGFTGAGDDYRFGISHFPTKKLENRGEESNIIPHPSVTFPVVDVKQELPQNSGFCGQIDEGFQALRPWSQVTRVSSPGSCVTTSSSTTNILSFSNKRAEGGSQHPDHSSESNSPASGGISKKARVQAPSRQPPLKVRKEKLGDRITALHQLVSPFGKTDTASVLLESIGYIRFLQGQIEALSSPYLGNGPASITSQHSDIEDKPKDLRSRGLCLVPISCTLQVGTDINGADYWAPTFSGGF